MTDTEEHDATAPRNYVAVRLLPSDYKALRLLAAMERRSLGGYLESLLARSIDERTHEMARYVETAGARAALTRRVKEQEQKRSAA